MMQAPKISRRSFIIGGAAMGGGLALGLNIPFGPVVVRAADGSPEVNAWVVIRPDDTVVVLRVDPSAVSPSAFASVIATVPTEIDVVPVYVLAADKVRVPVPVPPFVKFCAPEMTPEIVASTESET